VAKIWCISAPLPSHSDWGGFLRTAQALQARGHELLWLSESPLQATIQGAGIPFCAISASGWHWQRGPAPKFQQMPPQEAQLLRYRRALNTWLHEQSVAHAVDALLALASEVGAPSLILSDPFLSAAAIAADALDIPLVICGWPAQAAPPALPASPAQRSMRHEGLQRLERLCVRFGVQGRNFTRNIRPAIVSETLHIVYFTASWYSGEQALILPQTQFVGGSPPSPNADAPQWLRDIPAGQPLGLVTQGTVFTGDLSLYSMAAQALASVGITPIVTLGWQPLPPPQKAALKRALPAGTRLLQWAPYEHILPRCRIAIHHGGMGTTHSLVMHSLLQIVLPKAADQNLQARRVADAKIGLTLTAQALRQGQLPVAVRALLEADWVQENARQLAGEMAALGGAERAADLLEGLA